MDAASHPTQTETQQLKHSPEELHWTTAVSILPQSTYVLSFQLAQWWRARYVGVVFPLLTIRRRKYRTQIEYCGLVTCLFCGDAQALLGLRSRRHHIIFVVLQRFPLGTFSLDEHFEVHEVPRLRIACKAIGRIKGEHRVEIMLVQLMSRSWVDEHFSHEPVLERMRGQLLGKVKNSKPARKVIAIGVVLDVRNGSVVSSPGGFTVLHHARLFGVHKNITVWIIEVVRNNSKRVDLEIL